ncbi:hypothetical protein BGZ58_003689 [Dissophora ornata]|nr:hypothetical protein BGZ58_003689 [Dissophora ornata]
MSSSSYNNNQSSPGGGEEGRSSAISDMELEQRLAKLKETGAAAMPSSDHELATHFSKVFGHSPAATHLSPTFDHPIHQQGADNFATGGDANMTRSASEAATSQRSMPSYFIPKSSELGQDEIDRILADSQDLLVDGDDDDDLGFLDDVLSPSETQQLKAALDGDRKKSGEQELSSVTQDLERTLSKFLQTHQPPPTAYHDSAAAESEGEGSAQGKVFGDQLDRMGADGMSISSTMTGRDRFNADDDDEMSRLITQVREEHQLEAKYGNLDEARLKELSRRHEELKKGIQGLSSVQSRAASQSVDTSSSLGPPPAAVGLDELRLGGGGGGGYDDDDPDNWCCKF